jgi:hypothetical protein
MLHFRGGEVADFKKLMTTPQHLPLKLGTMTRLCTLLWSPYDEIRHPLFRLRVADERRFRASRVGQLRRK